MPTIQGCWGEPASSLWAGDKEGRPSRPFSTRLPKWGSPPLLWGQTPAHSWGNLLAATCVQQEAAWTRTQAQGTRLVLGPHSQPEPRTPEPLSTPCFPPHPPHANISDQGPRRVSAEARASLRVPWTLPSSPARRTPYLPPRDRSHDKTAGRGPLPGEAASPSPRRVLSEAQPGPGSGRDPNCPGPHSTTPTPQKPHLTQPPEWGRGGGCTARPPEPLHSHARVPGEGPQLASRQGMQAEPGSQSAQTRIPLAPATPRRAPWLPAPAPRFPAPAPRCPLYRPPGGTF